MLVGRRGPERVYRTDSQGLDGPGDVARLICGCSKGVDGAESAQQTEVRGNAVVFEDVKETKCT